MNVSVETQDFLKKIALQTMPLLTCEYPVHIVHKVSTGEDVQAQRELHPLFYGCYDWHSAVHSYWQLLRIRKHLTEDDSELYREISEVLRDCFDNVAGIATETAYLEKNVGFERPYGLAWVLYLCREFCLDSDLDGKEDCKKWEGEFEMMEARASQNIIDWLPKLAFPIRGGLHNQTAFSLTLIWDWAVTKKQDDVLDLIKTTTLRWYEQDKDAPIAYEPSASDFLSPVLGTSSLMQRVMLKDDFLKWFESYLPDLESDKAKQWLEPVVVADENDGRLAHFAGLNLSRAWMLEEVALLLRENDTSKHILINAANKHLDAGVKYTLSDAYMLSHWVPSFAVYALTK